MITYSDLYDVLRKERYNERLQKLPKNFFVQLGAYFREKKAVAEKESEGSIFDDEIAKTKKQLENAKTMVKELLTLRERKILGLALVAAKTGIGRNDVENMLSNEKELLEMITKKIEEDGKKLNSILQGVKEKDLKNQLVRFTRDAPEFLDLDSSRLGPFKKGDVANLPREIVTILIENDQADIIEAGQ